VSIAVGGLTLVEATVLVLPFESRRAIATPLEDVAAVAMPAVSVPSQVAPAPSPRQAAASSSLERHPTAEQLPSVTPAAAEPEEQLTSGTESAVDATTLPSTVDGDANTEAVPAPSPVVTAVPTQPPQAAADDSQSVWSVAADSGTAVARKSADGGTAIGRKSKEAGVATAGFFSRVARRVAGSF
jgi:hypothetical protein